MFLSFLIGTFLASAGILGLLLLVPAQNPRFQPRPLLQGAMVVGLASTLLLAGGLLWTA